MRTGRELFFVFPGGVKVQAPFRRARGEGVNGLDVVGILQHHGLRALDFETSLGEGGFVKRVSGKQLDRLVGRASVLNARGVVFVN